MHRNGRCRPSDPCNTFPARQSLACSGHQERAGCEQNPDALDRLTYDTHHLRSMDNQYTGQATAHPAGFIERERTIERLDRLATLLDRAYRVPGTNVRFGLD